MTRLDAQLVQRFREDGFLSFDTGLGARDIAALRHILTTLHNKKVGFEEGALFDALGIDDGSAPAFPQILHPRSFAPELLDNDFYSVAHGIAEQLLGKGVRFKADISLLKPARTGKATPWHQDEAFQDPAFDYAEVSFWLPLHPVDVTDSCMAYVPGSHKGPVLPHGFPGVTSGSTRWSASAGSTPGMRSFARCPWADASSIAGVPCMAPVPTSRTRTGWPTC